MQARLQVRLSPKLPQPQQRQISLRGLFSNPTEKGPDAQRRVIACSPIKTALVATNFVYEKKFGR